MENQNNSQAVLGALGYPVALPQTVIPITKTQTQVQRTQYDPEKLQAVVNALRTPTLKKSGWESFANALANTPEARSFTGAYGTEVINPWAMGLSSLARGFGSVYGDKLASAREAEAKDLENMQKAAQLEAEATKQAITEQEARDYIKVNDPNAKTAEQQAQAIQQREAAKQALRDLNDLANKKYHQGGIIQTNNEADDWWLSRESSRAIGKREQALSALLPLTNSIARASGGSGINTIGEMLAYLGVPENATSAQLYGALPGLIRKLGFTPDEIYEMSIVPQQNQDGSYNINGYTVRVKK